MRKRNPKPDGGSRPSVEFQRFRQTMKRLLAVSKQELDELRAKERAEKNSGDDRPG
jgi:hypothetical protein